jgi:hypothetical protein
MDDFKDYLLLGVTNTFRHVYICFAIKTIRDKMFNLEHLKSADGVGLLITARVRKGVALAIQQSISLFKLLYKAKVGQQAGEALMAL